MSQEAAEKMVEEICKFAERVYRLKTEEDKKGFNPPGSFIVNITKIEEEKTLALPSSIP